MKQNNTCRCGDDIVSEKLTDMIALMDDEILQMFGELLEIRQAERDLTEKLVDALSGSFAGGVNAILNKLEGGL